MQRRARSASALLVAALLFQTACKAEPTLDSPQEAGARLESPSGNEGFTPRDAAVLEKVFEALVAYEGRYSPLDPFEPPDLLPVHAIAGRQEKAVDQFYRHKVGYEWASALTERQRAAAVEATDDLARRTRHETVLGEIRNVRVTTEPGDENDPWHGPIDVYAPGYSEDGEFAAVLLSFPGYHFTTACYLLCQQATGWEVMMDSYTFYH